MKWYKLDIKKLAKQQVKFSLRKPKRLAFLMALIAPLIWLYGRFKTYFLNAEYKSRDKSQVCYLQAALNDRWDAGIRRIRIVNGGDLDPEYLFLDTETEPLYTYLDSENQPVYLFLDTETFSGPDFIVLVPSFIVFDINEMTALINFFRRCDKSNYVIKIV